jgi:hypothetical protein
MNLFALDERRKQGKNDNGGWDNGERGPLKK